MKWRIIVIAVFVAIGGGITMAVARSAEHAGETTQVNETSDFTLPSADPGESGFDFEATTEEINSYSVDLEVQASGDMRVTEVIDYQFGVVPKHGIFRDVVVRERYDDRYDRVYPFELVSVTASEGTPDDVEVQEEGNFRRIRIGDPDTTISGTHRYEIVYELESVVTGFEDHDELFWDAIGAEWTVPIEEAVVTVSMPGPVTDLRCFAGGRGSQEACAESSSEAATATFRQENLSNGQGLTVVTAVDKGLIEDTEPKLDERWSLARAFSVNGGRLGVAGGLALLGIGGVALLIHRRGRDRRFVGSATDVAFGNQTGAIERVPLQDGDGELIPVEFVPPDGIRPGQLGTLVDEVAHPVDVTASIVDLASRGYLRIEEIEGKKQNWRFVKLRDADGALLKYEEILFKGLFPPKGRSKVTLAQLRTKFHTHLARVQDALYEDLVDRGWYSHRPDRVRSFWYAIGAVALLRGRRDHGRADHLDPLGGRRHPHRAGRAAPAHRRPLDAQPVTRGDRDAASRAGLQAVHRGVRS